MEFATSYPLPGVQEEKYRNSAVVGMLEQDAGIDLSARIQGGHMISEITFNNYCESCVSEDDITITDLDDIKYKPSEKLGDTLTTSESSESSESDSESENDWESVESSSGSEGDGLKRGYHSKENEIIASGRRSFLNSQLSCVSSDASSENELNPNFFKNQKPDDDEKSDGSMDNNDLIPKTEPELKLEIKNPAEREAIEEAAPLPIQLQQKNNSSIQNSNPELDLFEALVEQLDASMISFLTDEKSQEKPGPARSPGHTSHEKLYRQNFSGNTLNMSQGHDCNEDESDEPDFFDDDIDEVVLPRVRSSIPYVPNDESENYNSTTINTFRKMINNKEENQGIVHDHDDDKEIEKILLDATNNTSKVQMNGQETKKNNIHERETRKARKDGSKGWKMLNLIDLDPWDRNTEFDEKGFLDLIERKSRYCRMKYKLKSFNAEVFPLSALCALGASLKAVKKCSKAAPHSVQGNDRSVGTPLHYACSFGASVDVIKYLVKKYPDGIKETDEFKRTPLHVAALFKANIEVISMLLKECPEVASEFDEDNMTPLHLAIENEDDPDIDIINKLIRANPSALTARSSRDGVTPLMLAVARQCSQKVLRELIHENKSAVQLSDKEGRLPLHVALALKADLAKIKLLANSYPEGISIKDNSGDTPWDVANNEKLPKDVLELLSA